MLDPVEGFVPRQLVQHHVGAGADQILHLGKRDGVDGGTDFAPLLIVFGRVHADEAGALHAFRGIVDLDAAQFVRGRECLVIDLDLDNVLVLRD